MKGLTNRKNVIAIFALFTALLFSASPAHAQRFSAFSAPQNLGASINTTASEVCPFIAPDNLSFYFASDRAGGAGGFDLYVSTRPNANAPWGAPVNLGAIVNTASVESRPSLSFDGRELYFHTNRPNGSGANDIYVSRRRPLITPYDTDGDGRTDIRAYRQSANAFYLLNSSNNSLSTFNFGGTGQNTFIPGLSDDYDGDGKSDLVVSTVPAGGVRTWRILQSGSNTIRTVQWGLSSDQNVPADYDGDGRIDVAVYRRSEGIWYILLSATNQLRAEYWGQAPNDFPVVGDFDGDGINDLTVIRSGTGSSPATWFTRRSSDGAMLVDYWGDGVPPGAVDNVFPAIAPDVDGDGIADRMVVRDPDSTTTGNQLTYFIQRSSDRSMFAAVWGLDTDGRAFGDFDGDGKTDLAARRSISGQLVWFILLSSNNYNPTQARVVYWGIAGDI